MPGYSLLPLQHSCFLTGLSFSCHNDVIPIASRIQSDATRQLLEASEANGQTKLYFFTQSVVSVCLPRSRTDAMTLFKVKPLPLLTSQVMKLTILG